MKKLFLTAIMILTLVPAFSAETTKVEGGLLFRSYEVAPNLRTSMRIPAKEEGHLKYDGYLALSFDVKIDTKKECFGYICRIILDNKDYADIVLTNPTDGETHLALASKHGELMKIDFLSGESLKKWNHIDICLSTDDNKTDISVNGVSHHLTCSQEQFQEVVVCFGANNMDMFSTSDVAPMAIRNVALCTNKRSGKAYHWELQTEDDLKAGTGKKKMTISVENPEWLIESNSSWQLSTSLSFSSKVKIVVDNEIGCIHLITKDCVTTHILSSKHTSRHPFSQDISFNKLTNDFIVLPGGRLMYFDPEGTSPAISEFDFKTHHWTPEIQREIHSSCLHHNIFYNRMDSCVVHLFGYGFHKYSNDISIWNESDGSFRKWTLDSIPPRYLSAVGVSDSLAWIYGGKGNEKGIQELGTSIYNDLYTISLNDYSLQKVCTIESDIMEVAASDLIISDDSKSITALFYSPNEYKANLQMKKINIENGIVTAYGDNIPYNFLDIDSEARLIYDSKVQTYFTVTTQKSDDDIYHVNIYRIKSPVIAAGLSGTTEQGGFRWIYIVIMVALSAAAAFWLSLRFRKVPGKQETVSVEPMVSTQKHGIYLIGGFKVIDRNGDEISSNFTPLMKQLLSILILYSYRQKGISNAELKEALWDDKSEESYYNNRGVNIKKIRTCINSVGNIEIASSNGNWSIRTDDSLCDWFSTMSLLETLPAEDATAEQLNMLIDTAMSGPLLPDMRYEWTDRFKAQYADLMISCLAKVCKSNSHAQSPDMRIRLADAILMFDSLDEYAVKTKCRALIVQKRLGIAQSTFKNFTQEYYRLMGEEFTTRFNEFVR